MSSAEIIARGLDPHAERQKGGHWLARCPCHADGKPSLWLKDRKDGAAWKCLAGCPKEDVTAELKKRGLIGRPNGAAGASLTRKARKPADRDDDWRPVLPVPDGAPEPGLTHPTHGQPVATWTYRDAARRLLLHVCRFEPEGERKQILPRVYGSLNGKSGWYWRHPAPPRPLYGLDRLAARPEAPVVVAEGEKAADAGGELLPDHVVITWPGGSGATDKADWTPLEGRRVWLWPDHDDPGRKAAEAIGDALLELAAEVRIVDLPGDLPAGWDLADDLPDGVDPRELLEAAEPHLPTVDRLIERAADDPGAAFEAEAIDFLAALRDRDRPAYERARPRLRQAGVRVAELDKVLERLAPMVSDPTHGQGRPLDLPEIEPWPEAVAGGALLDAIFGHMRRFVVLAEPAAIGVALWALHCHAHDAAFVSPRLALASPTMRCGKSSLLRWLARVTPRPLPTSNISAAAMFRVIEAAYPTLLIDELDQVDQDKRAELVGVINSSHCRLDAQIIRAVGDDYEPRAFSTWAPMALAAIGKLPPTWADRSIVVEMQRKRPDDRTEGMRLDRDQGFDGLRRKAARWAQDHLERLRGADPRMPAGLNDRQADNWRLLLAIADLCGGAWPEKARSAAVALARPDEDADARGIQALADIRQAFADHGDPDDLTSDQIVSALVEMEGRPWAEYRRDGKSITKHALARLLKPFGVSPGNLWRGGPVAKGYKRDSLAPLWDRYIQTARPLDPAETAEHGDFQTAMEDSGLAVRKSPKPTARADPSGLAVSNPPSPAEDEGIVI